MIITCQKCDTRFNLDESLLKQTGSKVRCSKCKHVFLAYPSSLSEEPDKSREVETEREAKMSDEGIEPGIPYKAEKESEGMELSANKAFEETTNLEEAGLELELELAQNPEIDETQAETAAELELELSEKTDSEISAEEEPEGINIGIDREPDISPQREDKETETKIEVRKQEDIDQDKTPGEYTAEKIEEDEESSKTFDMGVLPDEQKTGKGAFTETSESPKIAANRRISMPVRLLLLAALLIGGAYATYRLLDNVGIHIPFVSDVLKSEVQDAGNLKIYPSDINNKFLENSKIGKLFVITGQAKNGYTDARSYISITGKLYTKGKILSKTKTVYCGTVLSELELLNMDLDAINKRLSNRFGDNNSNMKVKEGSMIPFMIVFADLPENLDEFTIEVTGSLPSYRLSDQ